MYNIKEEFENKIINIKKNGLDIKFDTSKSFTQYQLHNMYQLDIYAPYISHTNELLPFPMDHANNINEPKVTELEYITLPKQEPITDADALADLNDQPRPNNPTTKPRKKRTKKIN